MISAVAAMFLLYVCIFSEFVSISVSFANVSVLLLLGTVSTSGLHLLYAVVEVGQCGSAHRAYPKTLSQPLRSP